jgi:hypothetical protein
MLRESAESLVIGNHFVAFTNFHPTRWNADIIQGELGKPWLRSAHFSV